MSRSTTNQSIKRRHYELTQLSLLSSFLDSSPVSALWSAVARVRVLAAGSGRIVGGFGAVRRCTAVRLLLLLLLLLWLVLLLVLLLVRLLVLLLLLLLLWRL